MRKELDEKLIKKYPKIFRDRNGDMRSTLMCWGFECGDGWYDIIDVLCSNIQNYVDNKRKGRADAIRYNRALKRALNGDRSAMDQYFNFSKNEVISDWSMKMANDAIEKGTPRIIPSYMNHVVAVQVKEKFGGLRFYISKGDDAIYAMVSMAESMSYRTCETCGSPGKSNSYGWISTLCDKHRLERDGHLEDDNEDEDETS